MAEPISAKQLANELGTDARTCRKFLREASGLEAPGQGARWNFERKQLKSLTKKFQEWQGAKRQVISKDIEVEELADEDFEELDFDDEDIEEI
jgi:hypothetical protein